MPHPTTDPSGDTEQVDPVEVINQLGQQIGGMAAQLAMRDVALAAARKRIAELEAATPLEPGRTPA